MAIRYIKSGYNGKKSNHEWLNILPIGDLHIGSPNFCERTLLTALNFAKRNRQNTRILLMGDLAETATKTSVGAGSYEQIGTPQEQVLRAVEYFRPYKDLIDGVITGNHEQRVYKATGTDMTLMFCQLLGIENKYLRYQGAIKFNLGRMAYNFMMWHGAGGGSQKGGKVNRMNNMARLCEDIDVYLMGHVHELGYVSDVATRLNKRTMEVNDVDVYYVFTGSALDYEGGYAEEMGLKKSVKGFPLIKLANRRGEGGRAFRDIRVLNKVG